MPPLAQFFSGVQLIDDVDELTWTRGVLYVEALLGQAFLNTRLQSNSSIISLSTGTLPSPGHWMDVQLSVGWLMVRGDPCFVRAAHGERLAITRAFCSCLVWRASCCGW